MIALTLKHILILHLTEQKKRQVFSPMIKIRWFMCYMVQLKLEISFVE